jgi:hypothetical protein
MLVYQRVESSSHVQLQTPLILTLKIDIHSKPVLSQT